MSSDISAGDGSVRLYKVLVRNPGIDIDRLTKHLNWSVKRVERALAHLASMSLVEESVDIPGEFHAISPTVRAEPHLARREAALHQLHNDLAHSRAVLSEMLTDYTENQVTRIDTDVHCFPSLELARLRAAELMRQRDYEVMACVSATAQPPSEISTSDVDRCHTQRVRAVYWDALLNLDHVSKSARWLSSAGGDIRTIATLPILLEIYDHRVAIVPLDSATPATGVALLCGEGVLSALCELFESVWESAVPLETSSYLSDRGRSHQEEHVLRLMARGMTDEAVARHLGVSVRSVRRSIARLMRTLGAHSRFQAGTLAASAGWLTSLSYPSNPQCFPQRQE